MKRGLQVMIGVLVVWTGIPAATARANPAQTKSVMVSSDDVVALQADAKKMQLMINQMRANLASVASTTTPLGHQFELEIDMWQMILDQMQRRIGVMEKDKAEK